MHVVRIVMEIVVHQSKGLNSALRLLDNSLCIRVFHL